MLLFDGGKSLYFSLGGHAFQTAFALLRNCRVVNVALSLSIFRLRQKSLVRGIVLSLTAFISSLLLAGFPHIDRLHGSPWQMASLIAAAWGMAETGRCIRGKWSLYHAGVLILLYSDLVILTLIVFLVAYPL
jgi:hypothetical protein